MIRVRENGIGIAKENHRSVFGVFRRMHSETIPGTGMGLAYATGMGLAYARRSLKDSEAPSG
jgi:signal transduction histidine kinase